MVERMSNPRTMLTALAVTLALAVAAAPAADAQFADRKALTLDGAKRIMAAAEAEAAKNK